MVNFEGNFLDCHLIRIFLLVFVKTDNISDWEEKHSTITEVCRQRYRNMQIHGVFEKNQ